MGNAFRWPSGEARHKITFQGTHCTFSNSLVKVKKGGTVSVLVYPESDYVLEQVVTSIPYEYAYDRVTKVLSISNVTDNLTVTVNYASFAQSFGYTGAMEQIMLPYTGYYEVEVGGGAGGASSAPRGSTPAKAHGGLLKADFHFIREQILYVYCGGVGGNGGTPSAGAGAWGHDKGKNGTNGTMGSDSGYGYGSGGSGGGGSTRVETQDKTVYADASGGGGSSGGQTGSATGGSGGTGGNGGGPNGGKGRVNVGHAYNDDADPGYPGGQVAVGATNVVLETLGGNLEELGYAKITYLGITLDAQ